MSLKALGNVVRGPGLTLYRLLVLLRISPPPLHTHTHRSKDLKTGRRCPRTPTFPFIPLFARETETAFVNLFQPIYPTPLRPVCVALLHFPGSLMGEGGGGEWKPRV